jgi:HAD superfamily hydrolase (TIGR01509 family)
MTEEIDAPDRAAVPDAHSAGAVRARMRVPARAVVWDMDGTLLDSSVLAPAAYAAAVRELGGPVVSAAQVFAAYPLGPPDVILAHLTGRPVSSADMEAYYSRLERATVRSYDGVADALSALRSRGRAVAVFTGASTRAAAALLAAAGLAVDILIGGDEVRRPKPAPDGLIVAAERLGLRPEDLAYVGDSPLDMLAARAAGSHGAAASWGHMYDPAVPADSVLATPGQALDLLD